MLVGHQSGHERPQFDDVPVLLHQELDQVGLQIGVAHPIEDVAAVLGQQRQADLVGIARALLAGASEDRLPERPREDREVLVEERAKSGGQREEGAIGVAAKAPGQSC